VPDEQSRAEFAVEATIIARALSIILYIYSMVLVFNQGVWTDSPLPEPLDRAWSKDHQFTYASIYQQLRSKGFSHEKSSQVAEAYIYREIAPKLKFTKEVQVLLEIASRPKE
jgi:hypothetical protein